MIKAVKKSGKDYMGFTWFEIFKNSKTTGNQFKALNKEHAIKMYEQFEGLS
jgi:hypothetical protein